MSIVTIMGVTPSARFDGTPWFRALIQEGPASNGPWVQIQNIPLNPIDADPTDPESRDFSFPGTIDSGWYRVIFADQAGNQLQPSSAIQNILTYVPTREQVGVKILSRTRDTFGNLLGTFTANTTPTAEQVDEIIVNSVSEIANVIGDSIPAVLTEAASNTVALYAAMQIELTIFSDQVNTGRSIYPQLEKQFDDGKGNGALPRLKRQVDIISSGEEATVKSIGPGMRPSYHFPYREGIFGKRW